MENKTIRFIYKNWRCETTERHVLPIEIWFGSTDFHTTPQWLMKAIDQDKQEERDFAIEDIISFIK
jgi:predicted DNA-binding transcriptional regulator YafY